MTYLESTPTIGEADCNWAVNRTSAPLCQHPPRHPSPLAVRRGPQAARLAPSSRTSPCGSGATRPRELPPRPSRPEQSGEVATVAEPCPRCGGPLYQAGEARGGRGRPRRWCSAECRKLAGDERRAAERNVTPRKTATSVARDKGGTRPPAPERTVERVPNDSQAIEHLLGLLAHRMRSATTDPVDRRAASRAVPLLADLLDLCRSATTPEQPTVTPPPAPAPRHPVTDVLASPRATRELLDALTAKARAGELLAGPHSGTVHATQRLVRALAESRTIRVPTRY